MRLFPWNQDPNQSTNTYTRPRPREAVISIPTMFAREILRKKRGLLCKFFNTLLIAACVKRILRDPILRHELQKNASIYGPEVGWTRVTDQHGAVFRLAMGNERVVTESAIISQTADGPNRAAHAKLATIVRPARITLE